MRRLASGAAALLCTASIGAGPPDPRPIRLFDGRTLNGWEQGTSTGFHVEKGAITGGTIDKALDKKTFLCTTREYGDFRLTARFRLDGDRYANTGIQFRTRRVDPAATQVIGYQADAGYIYWGTLYDEGRRKATLVDFDQQRVARHLNDGRWNRYEIIARGRHIVLTLNGVKTVDYVEPDPTIPQTGHICLQLHDKVAMTVAFKDILLTPLADGLVEGQ
jgi:hypothetical protein